MEQGLYTGKNNYWTLFTTKKTFDEKYKSSKIEIKKDQNLLSQIFSEKMKRV